VGHGTGHFLGIAGEPRKQLLFKRFITALNTRGIVVYSRCPRHRHARPVTDLVPCCSDERKPLQARPAPLNASVKPFPAPAKPFWKSLPTLRNLLRASSCFVGQRMGAMRRFSTACLKWPNGPFCSDWPTCDLCAKGINRKATMWNATDCS
jgi:hypothetical protein